MMVKKVSSKVADRSSPLFKNDGHQGGDDQHLHQVDCGGRAKAC